MSGIKELFDTQRSIYLERDIGEKSIRLSKVNGLYTLDIQKHYSKPFRGILITDNFDLAFETFLKDDHANNEDLAGNVLSPTVVMGTSSISTN